MAGPSDQWLHFYRRGFAGEEQPPSPTSSGILDRGVVSDTPPVVITSVSTPGTGNSTGGSSSSSTHLNPEGRVAKPSRRRSRASRRAPTTLLNTDTTNFRAMVQQFTGIPSAPFNSSGPQTGAISNLNFEVGGGHEHHLQNTATIMAPGGYNLHQQQQVPQHQFQHQQQQQQFQQQQLQYMLSMKNNSSHDVFRQRFHDGNQ